MESIQKSTSHLEVQKYNFMCLSVGCIYYLFICLFIIDDHFISHHRQGEFLKVVVAEIILSLSGEQKNH